MVILGSLPHSSPLWLQGPSHWESEPTTARNSILHALVPSITENHYSTQKGPSTSSLPLILQTHTLGGSLMTSVSPCCVTLALSTLSCFIIVYVVFVLFAVVEDLLDLNLLPQP